MAATCCRLRMISLGSRLSDARGARHFAKPGPPRGLHVGIIGPAATFGNHPVDVLGRVLDVAGLAVDAVLRVDLQPRPAAGTVAHDLVYLRRAVARLRRGVSSE